jgi:hypothetical protein
MNQHAGSQTGLEIAALLRAIRFALVCVVVGLSAFPNIGGLSSDSLMAIREEMGGGTRWSEHYRYVPGLHQDDREMSERLTTEQLKRRLGETIDFVRANARPHWQQPCWSATFLLLGDFAAWEAVRVP